LDSPYVASLLNVFIQEGTLYYISNCIVSFEDYLTNELHVRGLKTLAYCIPRALPHHHEHGLMHGSVCTEDMFLHTTGFTDSLWRFKIVATGQALVQYRPDLSQLGLRHDESVSPAPAGDIVELGLCLRDLADRGKVGFKGMLDDAVAEAEVNCPRAELEAFVNRLIEELLEGQEATSPPCPLPHMH